VLSDTITAAAIEAAILRVAARLPALRDPLNQLDAAMGDGDLGISVAKAGPAIEEYVLANPPGDDIGRFLASLGMAINRAASSTMGALTATALMRAGKEAKGMPQLDAATLARLVQSADAAVQERGKAQPGDKTVVDALHPAAEAFARAVEQGEDLRTCGRLMLEAARAGRDSAIPLRSKIGRAAWVGERTENQPDPGTVLFVEVLEAIWGSPDLPTNE
jgi:phosphoenolpyruvate---glycerone phosphotransferase subunit DhaL